MLLKHCFVILVHYSFQADLNYRGKNPKSLTLPYHTAHTNLWNLTKIILRLYTPYLFELNGSKFSDEKLRTNSADPKQIAP